MSNANPNPRNTRPISLHPLTTNEALRRALNVKKEDVDAAEKREKAKPDRKKKDRKA